MAKIKTVQAREVIDSRGEPTVEAEVVLENGIIGRASVPSGASTGVHEARELRDNDKNRFQGKGVLRACKNINTEIRPRLMGLDVRGIASLDQILCSLDNTENKSRLGANAILAVSLACSRAAALTEKMPLYEFIRQLTPGVSSQTFPLPLINVIEGGRHADNNLDFQEYLIAPKGFPSFREALRAGAEIYQSLKSLLQEKGLSTAVGDEGGFAPLLKDNFAGLDLISQAVTKDGYQLGKNIYLALDLASSEFFRNGFYEFKSNKDKNKLTSAEMIDFVIELTQKYPLILVEDPLAEDDWENWTALTKRIGPEILLVGDDLFTTNPERLRKGINKKAANAILIKPNQIGTLSETLATINLARENNYQTIISHRSGETEDPFIADLAVGTGSAKIKAGSLSRSERMAKYNQLLRIEEELCP